MKQGFAPGKAACHVPLLAVDPIDLNCAWVLSPARTWVSTDTATWHVGRSSTEHRSALIEHVKAINYIAEVGWDAGGGGISGALTCIGCQPGQDPKATCEFIVGGCHGLFCAIPGFDYVTGPGTPDVAMLNSVVM